MTNITFSDSILKQLVKKYPPPNYIDRSEQLFERLIESIISQQLSVKASDTIFNRFIHLFSNPHHFKPLAGNRKTKFPQPEDILKTKDEILRSAGISFQKISYIKSVAQTFLDDGISIRKIQQMPDAEVIAELTKIKGVGKWTAEMILISTLARPDVFSLGDLGLRTAIKNLYGITEKEEILALTHTWSPHRSAACWYLWKSLENTP